MKTFSCPAQRISITKKEPLRRKTRVCSEVSVRAKMNFLEPYTFVLWPTFEAQKLLLFKEQHNNGVHFLPICVFLDTFERVGVSCDTSEALRLTFP